jgi:hypothetical protein
MSKASAATTAASRALQQLHPVTTSPKRDENKQTNTHTYMREEEQGAAGPGLGGESCSAWAWGDWGSDASPSHVPSPTSC